MTPPSGAAATADGLSGLFVRVLLDADAVALRQVPFTVAWTTAWVLGFLGAGDAADRPQMWVGLALVLGLQIAAAFLRHQLAARPAAEELADGAPPVFDPSKGERPDTRFENGVWFTISVGRKHRAEPRWLLPLICKAGKVTKREIGSIRILDTESRFEIAADRAEGFAAAVREGTGEKGVVIQRVEGDGKSGETPGAWKKKPHRKGASAHTPTPGADDTREFKPKKKFKPKKRPAGA